MSIRIELRESIGSGLVGRWDALAERCGAPVFYRSTYLAAYESAPLQPFDAHAYLVGYAENNDLVAVLPMFVQPRMDPLGVLAGRFPGVGPETAGVLTHVWHCYDTWLPAHRLGPELLDGVLGAMRRLARDVGAAWYGFVNVDSDSELVPLLRARGFAAAEIDERFTLDLSRFSDLEEYIGSLKPRARANLRRYRRRAAEAGLDVACLPAGDAALDSILALVRETAAKFGNASFYPQDRFQEFVRRAGECVRVVELRLGGRVVAAGICLTDSRRFHTWTCGVDYAAAGTFSPYYVLFLESVGAAIALGAPRLEGGRRNAAFKLRHGLTRRRLVACLAPVGRWTGGRDG